MKDKLGRLSRSEKAPEVTEMDQFEPKTVDTSTVLRRAIEVDQLVADIDLDTPLDRQALAQVAAEAGISSGAVAVAIAEARAGALERRSLLDRIIGPKIVSANRTVTLDDEQARARLVEWLSITHGLRPRVRSDGVVIAAKRHDLAGRISTRIRRFQGLGGLSTANSVTAAAVGSDAPGANSHVMEQATTHDQADRGAVCVVANVGSKRNEAIVGGSAVATSMSAVVGIIAVITGPAALIVGIPVAAGVGTILARHAHRTTVTKIRASVDHTVDGVAQGEDPPRPLGAIVRSRRADRSS